MPDGLDPDTQPLATQPGPATGWLVGGRYRVLARVGSGGMAEVFRAHDDLLNRDVAVKVFRTMLDDPDGSTNGAARRELELQSLAQLNHPNLITLFDGSVAGDGPSYLVLEYVDGPDLASRLRSGPLTDAELHQVGAQIADALAYVHAHGLVHRDVKPANILLGTEEGPGRVRARLSDFGIVRMIGSPPVTSAELTVGTAYYIAPEQARGSSVGPEADVYALGLVLLEALTGRRAFDGPMHEALAARLARDPEIPADAPAPWPALLRAMTAADPAARPTAAQVADQLRTEAITSALGGAVPLAGLATAELATAGLATAGVAPVAATAAPVGAPAAVAAFAAPAAAEAVSGPMPTRHRRLTPVWLLAAAVLLGAGVLAAFLLQRPPAASPVGGPPTAPVAQPHGSSSARHASAASVAADVRTTPSRHRSSTSAHSPSASTSRPPSSSAPPSGSTASHPPTSSPPTSPSASGSGSGSGSSSSGAGPAGGGSGLPSGP